MNYIFVGLLIGLGWRVAELAYDVIFEILFNKLHRAKWYCDLNGKKPPKINGSNDEKTVRNRIGF